MWENGQTLREKTLLTLYQYRKSSPKFTRIPLFIKTYSYFFKSKWGFFFNLVQEQANDPRIKSSTFNYSFNLETLKHDSRSSFIAPLDHKVSWRSNQRNLLYSFIVKIHTKDCTHIYTNHIEDCHTIFWSCDLSFTKIVCTNFWHTQWDLFSSHLFLLPRNLQVSNLTRSMASKKSQLSKNATKRIGGSISSRTSTDPITRNKAKAMELFTSQEADGKAPMTKLVNASTQPKTFISLSTLRARKHTIAEKENSTFTL